MHRQIAALLEKVERGESDRVMIFVPPRHGKSTTASIYFPAWYLGRNPRREIIAAAYGGELVANFGAKVRNIMNKPEHAAVFGESATLAPDTRARDLWLTKAGGTYRAAGVGAGITGFGGHVILIDDPTKSREEANSRVIRNRNWEWFKDDVYTRLMDDSAIVIIQTRWHEDDLAGRILAHSPPTEWEVLHLPAINSDGEALWPEKYDLEYLGRAKQMLGARSFQSLYQGSPTPEEGKFFKREWMLPSEQTFTPEDARQGRIRTYGASDYAVLADEGDWTVHIVVGVDPDDNVHVLDLWREQATPDRWTGAMLELASKWNTSMWAEEKGGIQRAAEPYILKRMNEERIWFARHQFPSVVDKETRALAIQGRMASEKVFWPTDAPWFAIAETEMLTFPGTHDDIVDALSLIGRMLNGMRGGRLPSPAGEEPPMLSMGGSKPMDGTRRMTWRELLDQHKSEMSRKRKRRA